MMASVALVMAQGALGEVDGMSAVFDRALDMATTSFQASHMRFWLGSVYARACRLTGRSDDLRGIGAAVGRLGTRRARSRVRQSGIPARQRRIGPRRSRRAR